MICIVHILQYVQYHAIRAVYEPSRDITKCTILLYEYYIVHSIVHVLYLILCTTSGKTTPWGSRDIAGYPSTRFKT